MTVKQEYPRPQFVRKPWQCLNGMWDFSFDDTNAGIREKWYEAGRKLEKKICVPFVYQCEKSGIGDTQVHEILWYKKRFTLGEDAQNREIFLHFEAVDYEASVYLSLIHI